MVYISLSFSSAKIKKVKKETVCKNANRIQKNMMCGDFISWRSLSKFYRLSRKEFSIHYCQF